MNIFSVMINKLRYMNLDFIHLQCKATFGQLGMWSYATHGLSTHVVQELDIDAQRELIAHN